MKVAIHQNGTLSVELSPERQIEKIALDDLRRAVEMGRKPMFRATANGLTISVETAPEAAEAGR